jgi:hypothetical protein
VSSLSDVQRLSGYYAEQATAEAILTAYLEALSASLIGIIPLRERIRLREEAEFHLERLTNAYVLEGMVPTQAAKLAIDKYGSASEVAQQFLDAWYAHHPQGRLVRRVGLGIVTALTWFGAATLLVTLLIQYRAYHPEMGPLEPGGTLMALRRILPAPWPSVEINPLFLALWGVAILVPFVAGWMTGSTVLVRSARAVWQAQTALTLYTFTLGMQLLPTSEGLLLALFQLFYWLPVGCLTAHLAAHRTIRRRCRDLLSAEARDEA